MKQFHVIGVMSGTSLDGIDFAEIIFTYTNKWSFELKKCDTFAYSKNWTDKLQTAVNFSESELNQLNKEYTVYLASQINQFITKNTIQNIDAVCSHGHTILHQPHKGITLQIGNLPELTKLIQQKVVCDFRVADVQLGGQGAPLVPIGDRILFPEYTYCMNLGGFSNVSFEKDNTRIAYDICAVNVVLNYYAQQLRLNYDNEGQIARTGNLNNELLKQLNNLPFYKENTPKSLGMEWVNAQVLPIIESLKIPTKDKLHTFIKHIATVISKDLNASAEETILVTGGGAYNTFLMECIQKETLAKIIIPNNQLVEYKEALIFGLLGVLKLNNKINVLSSVTGAKKDHSSGNVFEHTL